MIPLLSIFHISITVFDILCFNYGNQLCCNSEMIFVELSLGACLSSTLNDCDPENADCLVDGPRYECRCHDGWNDTSKEFGQAKGRRCGQLALITNG